MRMGSRLGLSAVWAGVVLLVVAGSEALRPSARGQAAAPPAPATSPPGRDQEIADILKAIEKIKQQVEALKSSGAPRDATSTSPGTAAAGALPADWVKSMKWRSIGPASMGGRITALAVFEADPATYWVATASGGLLKTENNGTTFVHQFDQEATVSIGDVAVAPSDKNIVWVGTGEANPRNSVSYGDGVYKSTDGGKTWTNMGLKKSFQIGKIVIHPKDPNTVYVGALGRLYGPNEERGLYKTSDGGKSWTKVLNVDDKTGVIDIAMHPTEPDTLIASMWQRRRDGFDSHTGEPALPEGYDIYDPDVKWGPGSGIHKTTDGGKTWAKLTKGLPTNDLGRVDIEYYLKDPKIVYAIIDCARIGMGTPPSKVFLGVRGEDAEGGPKLIAITANSPASKAGLKVGDQIKTVDKKPAGKYAELVSLIRSRKAGERLALEVVREGKPQEITVTLEDRSYGMAAEEGRGGFGFGGPQSAVLLGAQTTDQPGGGVKLGTILEERNAEKAGLKEDDIIVELEGKPLAKAEDLLAKIRSGKDLDKLALKVKRGAETKEITLTLLPLDYENPNRPYSYMYGGQAPNIQDQQGPNSQEYGGIYRSADGGESWTRINSLNPRPMYFSQIRVDPSDEKFLYVLGVSLHRSKDAGKTFTDDGGQTVHPDQHTLWINPKDGRHMVVGCDGGFYVTYDRMDHWEHLNHMAIAQFYHVAVDNKQPYNAYGGLQDNGSWGGPNRSLDGQGTINADWFSVSGGDGFVCRVDPFDSDLVYFESQNGALGRRNLRTGERGFLRPTRQKGVKYGFNWNTPFILSSHNPGIYYVAGNYVFRSVKKGDSLQAISGPISRTGRGTGTALGESPLNPDVLWAGTDDGALWISRDGGKTWNDVAKNVGLPGPRWVATVEPSRFVEGRCYVAFDGHRSDDDEPYLSVTEDFGATWKSVRANLPAGSTRCLREDLKNPDLLFTGTEFAVFASLDRGKGWTKLNNNLPTVAVHELAIHPTANEMVAATHGRSLWVLDITALRQMTTDALKAAAQLYEPNTVTRWRTQPTRSSMYGNGNQNYFGENPPSGAQLFYSLTKKAEKISLKVVDVLGRTVRELPVKNEPGLHLVPWDLSASAGPPRAGAAGGPPAMDLSMMMASGIGGGGGGRFRFGGRSLAAGTYRVVLTVDGKETSQALKIANDPTLPEPAASLDADEQEAIEELMEGEEAKERREKEKEKDKENQKRIDDD